MRRLFGFVVMACTLVGLALFSGPAMAKRQAPQLPVVPGSQYLALGDSVTFGYMEPQVVPAPRYHDAAAFHGYPDQLGAALRLRVANAACPGETSSSLINAHAQSNKCENRVAGDTGTVYRTHYPLHVRYKGSQLAYAVAYLKTHHNVRLVSLMIGANDYFLCQKTTKDSCTSAPELNALARVVQRNVRTIVSAIRNRAHYRGQLVIVNYYSLNYSSAAISAVTRYLNRNEDAPAKPFHVQIADGFGQLRAAAVHSGGNSCTAGLLTQLGGGTCGVHPSFAGQALLAQAVATAIKLG